MPSRGDCPSSISCRSAILPERRAPLADQTITLEACLSGGCGGGRCQGTRRVRSSSEGPARHAMMDHKVVSAGLRGSNTAEKNELLRGHGVSGPSRPAGASIVWGRFPSRCGALVRGSSRTMAVASASMRWWRAVFETSVSDPLRGRIALVRILRWTRRGRTGHGHLAYLASGQLSGGPMMTLLGHRKQHQSSRARDASPATGARGAHDLVCQKVHIYRNSLHIRPRRTNLSIGE